jgi:hypothetical protein
MIGIPEISLYRYQKKVLTATNVATAYQIVVGYFQIKNALENV